MRKRTISCSLLLVWTLLFCFPKAHARLEQYKKHSRDAITLVVEGRIEDAIEDFNAYLEKHPDDLESLYGLAVAYTQKQDLERAMGYARQALDAGLPVSRLLAGPRDLLRPLVESADFQELIKRHMPALIHGPLLGCVTDRSAKFWVRTPDEASVQVHLISLDGSGTRVDSRVVKTSSAMDFIAVAFVGGLRPGTQYSYGISVNGDRLPEKWSFRTYPAPGSHARFQVGFGGGAGYTPAHERMWNTIASYQLLAFLFLGDNVYIDHPTMPAVQQYCYYRRQSRPEFRAFTASTCIYAIWDDHDFTTNDAWGGPETDQPTWKIPVWRLFSYNWNNPSYGGGETQPGCWFSFSIADVDFFMLDGRYYRTDPEKPGPTMLGPSQKNWLLKELETSKATFKVLASPVPWSFGTKPSSLDTWEGYKEEREEIFSFIEDNRIEGIILISADRHRSDAWIIERPDGYDFYEFESSKLTNVHSHDIMPGALFGYNEKCSFGLLSFDTTLEDPSVSYRIINIDNKPIYELTLKKSQLSFPRQ